MQVHTFSSPKEIGDTLADHILANIVSTQNSYYLLGLPTGATPMPIITSLVEKSVKLSKIQKQALAQKLYIVIMDDFIEMDNERNINSSSEYSAVGFMKTHLIDRLNQTLHTALGLDRILYPKPRQINQLKEKIIAMGGIDLFIIATDPREGYVAQNFGNQSYDKTEDQKISKLNENFLKHHPWASVYRGITFSLQDFADIVTANSNGKFAFVIFGEAKKETLRQFIQAQQYRKELPVSFLWKMSNSTTVYTDQKI